jgi:predicted N-acetyltransferase YhbS
MLQIVHLFNHPQLVDAVAKMIYDEFWTGIEDGMTVDELVIHLKNASGSQRVPLSLIALVDGQLAGTVNLVENDDEKRTHLRPWLAAMVVRTDFRGQKIGTALVKTLLAAARSMKILTVYFGTDVPGFYERLGAVKHEQTCNDLVIMKFELASL